MDWGQGFDAMPFCRVCQRAFFMVRLHFPASLRIRIVFIAVPHVDVNEVVYGTFSVWFNAHDMLLVLGPGFENHSSLLRLVSPAR